MPFWMEIYFTESNSPIMEMMTKFHDYSMIILFSIMMFIMFNMITVNNLNLLNLNLMENQNLEMIWTIFPMFLLVFIAMPSLRILYLMEESSYIDLNVKVLGHQWYWEYEFPEFDLEMECFISEDKELSIFRLLETDDYLALPMESMIRFLVSSVDVIHSWTVQSLGVKTDAIPGRLNQINFYSYRSGIYFGQCSEICGVNHSFMPISLQIIDIEDFIFEAEEDEDDYYDVDDEDYMD